VGWFDWVRPVSCVDAQLEVLSFLAMKSLLVESRKKNYRPFQIENNPQEVFFFFLQTQP
jgi:hypothetical protein